MRSDDSGVVWRPRTAWEGCDLGVRLLQSCWRSAFGCYLAVAVPLMLLFAITGAVISWLPALLIWWWKPWLDRTILYALSRALFGAMSVPRDVWNARAQVFGGQFLATLTLRRLSASRSFTQPVQQLEGLRGAALSSRLRQITARHRGVARAMTQAFALAEFGLCAAGIMLQVWLAPHRSVEPWGDFHVLASPEQQWITSAFYAAAVLFLEPFYVAAGFGLYLNRRVELEAWDIEQEFRGAFV